MFGFGKKKPTPANMGHEGRAYYENHAPNKVEENKYTDEVRIPSVKDMQDAQKGFHEDGDTDKVIDQHYSPLGIPKTSDAWEVQNNIDDGKLHKLYTSQLLGSMSKEQHQKLMTELPPEYADLANTKDFGNMKPEDFGKLAEAVQKAGATEDFYKGLDSKQYTAFQEGVLDSYIAMANKDPQNSSFILDLMPTDTDMMKKMQVLSPNEFRAGEDVHKIREGSTQIADKMKKKNGKDHEVYGLSIPYANTKENIIRNSGVPDDGSKYMNNSTRKNYPAFKLINDVRDLLVLTKYGT